MSTHDRRYILKIWLKEGSSLTSKGLSKHMYPDTIIPVTHAQAWQNKLHDPLEGLWRWCIQYLDIVANEKICTVHNKHWVRIAFSNRDIGGPSYIFHVSNTDIKTDPYPIHAKMISNQGDLHATNHRFKKVHPIPWDSNNTIHNHFHVQLHVSCI